MVVARWFGRRRTTSSSSPSTSVLQYTISLLQTFAKPLPSRLRIAVLDVAGLVLVWRGLELSSSLASFLALPARAKFDMVGGRIWGVVKDLAKVGVPGLASTVNKETDDVRKTIEKSLGKGDHDDSNHSKENDQGFKFRKRLLELPAEGADALSLRAEMLLRAKVEDRHWQGGKVSGAVYHGEASHLKVIP